MGNSIKVGHNYDPPGPGSEVAFFQSLNVRWLNVFIQKVREISKKEFSLDKPEERLKWSEYFGIFVEIKESMITEASKQERMTWHPATQGFSMMKLDPNLNCGIDYQESETSSEQDSIPDDFTEDDPSVNDENDLLDDARAGQEVVLTKRKPLKLEKDKRSKELNPIYTNPIYFGYTIETIGEHDKKVANEKARLKERENRAIDKARSSRTIAIDALERSTSAQADARIEKIEKLENKYFTNKQKREVELERNERELLAEAFAIYERKWEMEAQAVELAHTAEISKMRKMHEEKSLVDATYLRNKREELESFKDAEKQEIPAAERLEEFARIEVSRSIDELDRTGLEMENMRLEYREMKNDFDEVAQEIALAEARGTIDKAKQRRLQEMRSMVSVAETRMREAQRKVQEALDSLGDAEVLLDRAVRLCKQQSDLLPLFSLIAKDVHLPSSCRLNALLIAMVILMNGPFEQKYTVLFRLFDADCEGRVGLRFILALFSSVQDAISLLRMLGQLSTKDELLNMVTRGFMSFSLNPTRDLLTEYELRNLVLSSVSHSSILTQALGLTLRTSMQPGAVSFEGSDSSNMSTYQRNRMSSLALLSRGMINLNMCKIRVHHDSLRFKACLQPACKVQIHERAMLMGQDDPLKPDYSRFYIKKSKADEYHVPPLDHGHLINLSFFEHRLKSNAAIRLQSWFRSRHDRKMAELAARHMAFKEAKQAAFKEMKAKVVREFKKRESGKGMGKMKWDAQVRMKQAKLRTMGQAVGRSDTVMVMMEEAISAAKEDIEARFSELEAKEEFSTFNFDRPLIIDDPARQLLDLTAKFGQIMKPSIGDTSMLHGDKESDGDQVSKLLTNIDNDDCPSLAASEAITMAHSSITSDTKKPIFSMVAMDPQRARSYILGKFSTPFVPGGKKGSGNGSQPRQSATEDALLMRGENEMELELRIRMALPEPPQPEHFFNRLRALNITMTKFKTNELLGEIPSKRLLIKYCSSHDDRSLAEELTKHFKFKSKQTQLVQLLRNIAKTDLENGTIRNHLFFVQLSAEAGILNLFEKQMASFEAGLAAMVDLRLQTNRKLKEETVLAEEMTRTENFMAKFRAQRADLLANMETTRRKFDRVLLSCFEVERKWRSMQRYAQLRCGSLDPFKKNIPLELRQNWVLRINQAFQMPDGDKTAQHAKYSEIRNVCREFLEIATTDAIIIVSEIYQPKHSKTISICAEHVVDGRAEECGRGLEGGRWFTYEAHNIQYKVCLDYDGVFNGSDEFASKAGGAERLGAQEYFKLQSKRLRCPLVVTIDYQGFRVLATSKLPIQNVSFNEEGDVRKVSEDLELGILSHGEIFMNKSKIAQTCLKISATSLNLAEHICKGSKDITSSTTFASAELQVYRGLNDEFYLQNFWRSFPPELPDTTPHLHSTARDQSVFWRFLRPEYVRSYKVPLSPDAMCAITFGAPDSEMHIAHLRAACRSLIDKVIPSFLKSLLKRDYVFPLSEGFGIDLTSEMHARGINIRHLGLLRSLLWHSLPGTVSLYHHETYVRTSQDLRQEVSDGDRICICGETYLIQETGRRKITHAKLPITSTYNGNSTNGLVARAGKTEIDGISNELRQLLLAEMLARTIKALVRLQMRTYNQQYLCTSTQFYRALVTEYLNIVTGSHPNAEVTFQQTLCDSVRLRFGQSAILPSERATLLQDIHPVLSYLVARMINMLGVRLCLSCESEFHERPIGFVFNIADLLAVVPITKHNIPVLPFADAMMVSLHAETTEKEVYIEKVLLDEPSAFLMLSERKGTRVASNKGSLGDVFSGRIRKGCELEHTGPIVSNKFVRAISFRPNAKAFVDIDYDPLIVPARLTDSYSVELYYYCTGGKDTVRVMMMSGRYAVLASRDNHLVVVFYDGLHEINIKMAQIQYDIWVHVVCTYDGTTLRCYLNSVLKKQVEVAGILSFKQQVWEERAVQKRDELHEAEKLEQADVKERSQLEATEFFQTKEGVATLKRLTKEIMESDAFQSENIGAQARDQTTALKEKRAEALKRAKTLYSHEHYLNIMREISKRYEVLLEELEEHIQKEAKDGAMRVAQGLRIGAASPNSKTVDGSHYFYGKLSCVSVYATCLSSDQVKDHYLCGAVDRRLDAQRMHAIAASKFELALKQGPPEGSVAMLNNYAKSLCSYLRIETPDAFNKGKSMGKVKIADVIQQFKGMGQGNVVAEILREIPREPENADLVSKGFLSLRAIDGNFFSKSETLQRKELVHIPFDFALLSPESPVEHWEAAAYIFREVVKDSELMYIYGEMDLGWLPQLQSAPLVISIVKAAMEDKNLRVVKIAEIFHDAGLTDMAVNDDDIQVLSQNLAICEGLDLAHCIRLTNASLSHIDRMNNVKVLGLNYCSKITDAGMANLRTLFDKLQVVSIEGLTLVTDSGFRPFADKCSHLQSVNVNKCPNISHEALATLVRRNPHLNSLSISGTRVGDEAFSLICSSMQDSGCGKAMVNIDISQCSDLTDLGVNCLAEVCPNLQRLNMAGLNRVSDIGVRAVCANCWNLQYLNVEDIFLLRDDAFWFSATYDGRRAANENMLVSLQTLIMTDCSNLTDRCIEGLAERCRRMDILTLQGCDKLTDTSLRHLADAVICTASAIPMCDTIHTLNLAYCTSITSRGILELIPVCACLEDLNLSGLASIVNDTFMQTISKSRPTLQRLTLQKCLLLSDAALCSIADYLWLEFLDVTGCNKLTDAGVEVLSEACNGLRNVVFRRVKRLTNKSVMSLMRNCGGIQRIDVQECPNITSDATEEARRIKAATVVLL